MQQQTPTSHTNNCCLDVPCTTYYFRETRPSADCAFPRYQLEAMVPSTQTFYYSRGALSRNTLTKSDLGQIQLFDDVYLPECNALTLRLVLITLRDGAYVCAPVPRNGTLRILSHTPDPPLYDLKTTATIPITETNWTTAHGATIYTWFHQYIEANTRGYFIHTGLTLLPSKTCGLPMFMTPHNLNEWLKNWIVETRNSRLFAQLSVRNLNNQMTMWRVIPLAGWSQEAKEQFPGQSDRNAAALVPSFARPYKYPRNDKDDVWRPIPANFTL